MKNETKVKIISFKDYKDAKHMGELREYPDSYEYCLIPNYEDKFAEAHTECIQMDECFANIINNGDHYVLISIIFSHEWNVKEIKDWIENYEINLYQPTTTPIDLHKINSIIDAKKFKDYPLVLSERGTKTVSLNPNALTEVTKEYETYKKITNTGLAQSVESIDEFLDKDDCLGREYPGVSGEEDESLLKN